MLTGSDIRDSYHSNPNMNPPTRQKLKHHRPLWREHIGVLLAILRLALLRRQTRSIVDGLAGGRGARRVDETLRVRGRAELVRLAQGSVPVFFLGLGGRGGGGEAVT